MRYVTRNDAVAPNSACPGHATVSNASTVLLAGNRDGVVCHVNADVVLVHAAQIRANDELVAGARPDAIRAPITKPRFVITIRFVSLARFSNVCRATLLAERRHLASRAVIVSPEKRRTARTLSLRGGPTGSWHRSDQLAAPRVV
jgi:hypothetical protein